MGSLVAVFSESHDLDLKILNTLKGNLSEQIGSIDCVNHPNELLSMVNPSVVILCLHKKQVEGQSTFTNSLNNLIELTQTLKLKSVDCQVILVTSEKLTLTESCQAVTAGIAGFIDEDDSDFENRLIERTQVAIERHATSTNSLQRSGRLKPAQEKMIVGQSEKLTKVLSQAYRASNVSDVPVLIIGESGTGKQRMAEYVHAHDDKRSEKPFVSVNCAAITGSLAESELFGHEKGAFTGATDSRPGYFRAANGGTILLDEIGELDLSLQPKILRVLQESLVRPVGSDKEYKIDVRVVAATNLDLEELVKAGKFRLDLYQRLKVIHLNIPPLRERIEDIPDLFQNFLDKYSSYYPEGITSVAPEVYDVVARNIGSGNIRELENLVRQILVFKQHGRQIELIDLPQEFLGQMEEVNELAVEVHVPDATIDALDRGKWMLNEAIESYEKKLLDRLVTRNMNQSELARKLGITRRTLYNKLQKYNIRQS